MSGIFKELIERRVFNIFALYCGATIALVEFSDIIVERYGLSDRLVDLTLAGLVSLLPAVLILAYNHGRPGKDTWQRNEKYAIPLNLVVTGIVLVSLYNKQPATQMTEVRQVTMDGEMITRTVAKEAFRKSVGIFFFDSELQNSDQSWLSYGLPLMIDEALEEHALINASTMYNNYANGMIWKSQRAGFEDPTRIPSGFQHELATDYKLDYFIRAKLAGSDDAVSIEWELYQTQPYQKVLSLTTDCSDPIEVAQLLADEVIAKTVTNTEESQANSILRPVTDRLSESLEAIKLYVQGKNELLLRNNHFSAIGFWEAATELDPSFALAYFELTDSYIETGQREKSISAIQRTITHDYKLRDPQRFFALATRYELTGQADKTINVYETWIDLYPKDTLPKNVLANAYVQDNRIGEALSLYSQSLQDDPKQFWLLQRLADLYIVEGERDKAIEMLTQYNQRYPNEYPPLIKIGELELFEGNLDSAREFYTKGSIISPEMVTPVLKLMDLALRTGNLNEIETHKTEAQFRALAPRQQASLLLTQVKIKRTQGRPTEALSYLKQVIELNRSFNDPIGILVDLQFLQTDLYVEAGAENEAWELIQELRKNGGYPINEITSLGAMIYHLSRQEPELALPEIEKVAELTDRFQRNDLDFLNDYSRGLVAFQQKNYDQAIEHYSNSLTLYFDSIQSADVNEQYYNLILALAYAQLANNQAFLTIETLQDILKSWPYHPKANMLLGDALAANNQPEASLVAYQKATVLWANPEPGFTPALELADKIKNQQQSSSYSQPE